MKTFMGINIIVSPHATELVNLFPDAKRTKRGRRRLLAKYGKRFPGLKKRVPCAFMMPGGMTVHPDVFEELKRRTVKLTSSTTGSR